MATDHFCLKWNNFHNSLVSAFESLQSSEDLVDVTLMCEGRNVKAHKVILSACSPYFRNLFKETPCQHPIIILKDVLHCDLIAILQFMYQGEVLITQDGLSSFLKTAELLQVSGLAGNTPHGAATVAQQNAININSLIPTPALTPAPVPPTVPIPVISPSSPPPIKKREPSLPKLAPRLEKENEKKKEREEKLQARIERIEPDIEPIQSCSYQPMESVVIKTESDDQDFDDMDYSMMGNENLDDPGPATEEQSILERSLKAQGMSPQSSKQYTIATISSPNQSSLSPHPEIMKNPCTPLVLVSKNNIAALTDVGKRKVKPAFESVPSKKMFIKSILPKVEFKNEETKPEPSGDTPHGAQFGKCPHCTKVYSNQSALKYHVRLVHSDMLNMFCCHLCPESFEYRESYKAHMWDKHCVRN